MEPKTVRDRLPELVVEKLALGEASSERAVSAADKARVAALQSENAEILARYPAHQVATQVRHRAAQAAELRRRWVWVPALVTAAGALAIGLWTAQVFNSGAGRGGDPTNDSVAGDTGRLKGGGPRLLLYRKEGAQAVQLRADSTAQSGDLIQLGYVASRQRYGVIVSVDARGGATLHFPATSDAPLELQRAGPIMLAQAFQLDDAPAFERFFLVTADEGHRTALSVALVLEKARALATDVHAAETAPLALPATLHQESFLLHKKAR